MYARPRRPAKSWSAPARSTRRNCWNCPASASPSACAISASRCATRCPESARTCATITCRARAGGSARRGSPSTTAADPHRPPAINFNFLSAPPDAELTVRAVRIACAIMTAPAMAPFQVTEIAPGADRTTDDEILDWVKKAAETTYHPVGTCKMGSDAMAVVDAQLRVHGIEGLRVADASIMPTLTSGNTNAPSIMIGEKAADMVLKHAA